jgi:hypothetical protein
VLPPGNIDDAAEVAILALGRNEPAHIGRDVGTHPLAPLIFPNNQNADNYSDIDPINAPFIHHVAADNQNRIPLPDLLVARNQPHYLNFDAIDEPLAHNDRGATPDRLVVPINFDDYPVDLEAAFFVPQPRNYRTTPLYKILTLFNKGPGNSIQFQAKDLETGAIIYRNPISMRQLEGGMAALEDFWSSWPRLTAKKLRALRTNGGPDAQEYRFIKV